MSGVACDINSRGYEVLHNATKEVIGHVKPYSLTGSLPVIRDLQVKHWFAYCFLFWCLLYSFGFLIFFVISTCRTQDLMFKLQATV